MHLYKESVKSFPIVTYQSLCLCEAPAQSNFPLTPSRSTKTSLDEKEPLLDFLAGVFVPKSVFLANLLILYDFQFLL